MLNLDELNLFSYKVTLMSTFLEANEMTKKFPKLVKVSGSYEKNVEIFKVLKAQALLNLVVYENFLKIRKSK